MRPINVLPIPSSSQVGLSLFNSLRRSARRQHSGFTRRYVNHLSGVTQQRAVRAEHGRGREVGANAGGWIHCGASGGAMRGGPSPQWFLGSSSCGTNSGWGAMATSGSWPQHVCKQRSPRSTRCSPARLCTHDSRCPASPWHACAGVSTGRTPATGGGPPPAAGAPAPTAAAARPRRSRPQPR